MNLVTNQVVDDSWVRHRTPNIIPVTSLCPKTTALQRTTADHHTLNSIPKLEGPHKEALDKIRHGILETRPHEDESFPRLRTEVHRSLHEEKPPEGAEVAPCRAVGDEAEVEEHLILIRATLQRPLVASEETNLPKSSLQDIPKTMMVVAMINHVVVIPRVEELINEKDVANLTDLHDSRTRRRRHLYPQKATIKNSQQVTGTHDLRSRLKALLSQTTVPITRRLTSVTTNGKRRQRTAPI